MKYVTLEPQQHRRGMCVVEKKSQRSNKPVSKSATNWLQELSWHFPSALQAGPEAVQDTASNAVEEATPYFPPSVCFSMLLAEMQPPAMPESLCFSYL
jgi:hypothetical protein